MISIDYDCGYRNNIALRNKKISFFKDLNSSIKSEWECRFEEKLSRFSETQLSSNDLHEICSFLKMQCVFEYIFDVEQTGHEVYLWGILLNFESVEPLGLSKDNIYFSYFKLIDNIENGLFNDLFDAELNHICVEWRDRYLSFLPNGWLECTCFSDQNGNDTIIQCYFDDELYYIGQISVPSVESDVTVLDFMKTESYSEYLSEKGYAEGVRRECDEINGLKAKILKTKTDSKKQMLELISLLLNEWFGVNSSDIYLYSSFRRDFDFDDELEIPELCMDVESKFNIEFTDEKFEKVFLVEDLLDLIIAEL